MWIDAAVGSADAEVARDLLRLAQAGTVEIIASTLLLVEVRARSRRRTEDAEESTRVHGYLQSAAITYAELDGYTTGVARGLVESHRLYNFDAVHLASAVAGDAKFFLTDDKALRKVGDEYRGGTIVDPFLPYGLGVAPQLF